MAVIENASTSDGEAVWDHRWHPSSTSWVSWLIDPSHYPPTHTHTPFPVTTRAPTPSSISSTHAHTPSPVSTRAHTPASVSDSVQDVSGSTPASHHTTPTADSHRLTWFIQMMINSERPVVVMGGPGSGKSTTTLMALRALHASWRTEVIRVNAGTTTGHLETALLSHVSRAAHDTLAPTTPTILCLDDVGTLLPGSRAGRYLRGVGRDRGLYDTTTRARWMALTRLNLVAVCTVEEGVVAAVGGADDDPWRGWAVYHLAHTEDAAATAITAAVAPLSPLQSHAHNALTHATVLIAERILPLVRRRQEPFAPASAHVLLWQVAATLRVSLSRPPTTTTTTTPSSPTSSSATQDMLTVWLHAVTSHALLPLCLSKVLSSDNPDDSHFVYIIVTAILFTTSYTQSRSDVWEEVQSVMSQSCGGLVRELPPHPPTPLWPPLAPTLTLARPTYTTPKEAARLLSQVEHKRRKGPTEAWVVGQHEGVAEGVSLVVDAVMALLYAHARTAPLLLVVGAATPDTALTLTLAADYLGTKLRSCTTESEVLVALIKKEDGGSGVVVGDDDGGASGGKEDLLTSTTGPSLIHIPNYLLRDADVLRRVLEVTAEEAENHARVCVVTGCRGDFVGGAVSEQLRWAARHGRVVCLPNHTHDHHTQFTLQLMARDKCLQSEGICGHIGIAEFLAGVHTTACCVGTEEGTEGGAGEGTEGGTADGAIITPRPHHHHLLPGVTALLNTIIVFSRLLKERKATINAKTAEVGGALERVRELESHAADLRNTQSDLSTRLTHTQDNIEHMTLTLHQREGDILGSEEEVTKLREEVEVVEQAREELAGEVEEYVEEVKAPLTQVTDEVAKLDIHRIRKLLSRSPISAIQLVFECAVAVMGSADLSWRAVRHATQDDNFCTKLAAVCVPGLKQQVISAVNEKLEQIKMSSEHMARVSDIGGILLQYLRSALFFWQRYHEDIQPRQARVLTLADQKKRLQVEMATKERRMRALKEEAEGLASSLKEEGERVTSLKTQGVAVEEELETVLEVIMQLCPHSERWRKELQEQETLLEQIPGECLLAATRLSYLAPLPPEAEAGLEEAWRSELVTKGLLLLSQTQQQHQEQQQYMRLVSPLTEVEAEVKEALHYYTNRNSLILVRDPSYLVEDFLGVGVWVRAKGVSWVEEALEGLTGQESRNVYLREGHVTLLQALPVLLQALPLPNTGSGGDGDGQVVVVVVTDDCCSSPCPVCSTHTLVNLALHPKGVEQQVAGTLLTEAGTGLGQEVQLAGKAATEARTQRQEAEAALTQTLTSTPRHHLTSPDQLAAFMDLIAKLDEATRNEGERKVKLGTLAEEVGERFSLASRYLTRLHRLTHTLAALHPTYCLPLGLLQERLSQCLASHHDPSHPTDGLLDVVSVCVWETLETRLQLRHRLTVAASLALARLNLARLNLEADNNNHHHDHNDYVRVFLGTVSLAETPWGELLSVRASAAPTAAQTTTQQGQEGTSAVDVEGEDENEEDEDEVKQEDKELEDEEEDEGGKKEESEEEKGEIEKEEEEVEEDKIDEDASPKWIPKECGKKAARKLAWVTGACSSLFPTPSGPLQEEVATQLVAWVTGVTDDVPPVFPPTRPSLQAAREVLLTRYLRQDLLVAALTRLSTLVLGHPATEPQGNGLAQALTLHARGHRTTRKGITDIIQVRCGPGVDPPGLLMATARAAGLPYYKLIFLSLATASQMEVRRRVVMAARRRTWLVLVGGEVASDALHLARDALLALPPSLTTPTIFCILPDHAPPAVVNFESAVVVELERPVSLVCSLAVYLPLAYTSLQEPQHKPSLVVKAAVLVTAYVFALLHARGQHGGCPWVSRPPLTETLLQEAIEASRHLALAPRPASHHLTRILAQVVCGSVLESNLDQHIVSKIFSDHLNDKMLSRVTTPSSRPASSSTRRVMPAVTPSVTPAVTSVTPATTSLTPATTSLAPASTTTTTTTTSTTTTTTSTTTATTTSTGGALASSSRPSPHTPTILLHSLSSGGHLTLPLHLPPDEAVGRVCEGVKRGCEKELLGLPETPHHHHHLTSLLLQSLSTYTHLPWVWVPRWSVLALVEEVRSALGGGALGPVASQVVREVTSETQAWQEEVHLWDTMQDLARRQLHQLQESVKSSVIQPAEGLVLLGRLVAGYLLRPQHQQPPVLVRVEGVVGHHHHEKDEGRAGRANLTKAVTARQVVGRVRRLRQELTQRYAHLRSWAESETPPTTVQLGLLASPGWWLTRLRQAVCTRAHWLLQGSVIYATSAKTPTTERPPQGVFVSGAVLVGGRWSGDRVVVVVVADPDDTHHHQQQQHETPLTLALCVSHAVPPAPVGSEWVPVLESAREPTPLFRALLPCPASLSTRTPLYILLR
ncbi:hypothetical protein Pmani_012837 [Petrolisthes manimaculis]|uniref:AAA+ ATPase domain-containing protein n=1 Tax=Petrolisthes manimaculis TaxID=1843537 RepID=A0AAE1PWF7_9EUCA|nr:hypothetical protein Pmani_012837 [Petrolisthes manimaculis]